jgi:hypothetical protein
MAATIAMVSFCENTKRRNSCANDTLSVHLMSNYTLGYTIDEVCSVSEKEMAAYVVSVMAGRCGPSVREFLCPPRNDKILVQLILFLSGSCFIILSDIPQRRSALRAKRKWHYVGTAS